MTSFHKAETCSQQ